MGTCRTGRSAIRILTAAVVFTVHGGAAAQDTRVGAHAQEQAARAAAVVPNEPNRIERLVGRLKGTGLFGTQVRGLRPTLGTIYPGGWLAIGAGYRIPTGDRADVDVRAAWSLKNFKETEASLRLPAVLNVPVALEMSAHWIDAPTVHFYGVGIDSLSSGVIDYGFRPTTIGVTASVTPHTSLSLGGGLDYLAVHATRGTERAADGVLTALPVTAQWDPRYLRTRAFAVLDRRRASGYTGSGNLSRVEVQDYADRSGARLGFRSAEAEVVQLIPIVGANWVIALRGLATVTDDRADGDVPFFLMPALGGNDTLRGYPLLRFRDRNRLLVNAEYRWTAARFLDMAAFYDAGTVASSKDALSLRDVRWSYGAGARFHGAKRTVFRMELARNDERAWRFFMSSGAAF